MGDELRRDETAVHATDRPHRHHDILVAVVHNLPEDYEPYGAIKRWNEPDRLLPDCGAGCAFFYALEARGHEVLGDDCGVCGNAASHRHGLLTFKHQGCRQFAGGPHPRTRLKLKRSRAVAAERQRCVDIVQAARFDEVDRDWRAIISMIEGGQSAETLKTQ